MKRILLPIIVMAAMMLGLTGCGIEGPTDTCITLYYSAWHDREGSAELTQQATQDLYNLMDEYNRDRGWEYYMESTHETMWELHIVMRHQRTNEIIEGYCADILDQLHSYTDGRVHSVIPEETGWDMRFCIDYVDVAGEWQMYKEEYWAF